MLILTAAARELIGRAFDGYGGQTEREIWYRWSAEHPDVRRGPNDPWDDGKPFDHEFSEAALAVLRRLLTKTKARADMPMSEDDLEDLDNELAYIRAVGRSVEEPPNPSRVAA